MASIDEGVALSGSQESTWWLQLTEQQSCSSLVTGNLTYSCTWVRSTFWHESRTGHVWHVGRDNLVSGERKKQQQGGRGLHVLLFAAEYEHLVIFHVFGTTDKNKDIYIIYICKFYKVCWIWYSIVPWFKKNLLTVTIRGIRACAVKIDCKSNQERYSPGFRTCYGWPTPRGWASRSIFGWK